MVGAQVLSPMSMPLRCAIYTRKSTEDGLDQEFNSLDAQREACEAYIKSQRHEGWQLVSDRFDDGGISGGTMQRPGLIRLLKDVEAGRIDIIVVYKVDRLTRSLADFAKIVELLDASKASFVSVTQQFNTTTSMGRLTLNMLLSFAQFEREVTAERIRDKIAASKKKGMWMGGLPPLGYDVKEKRLVVNETEAAAVRQIFDLYKALGTVRTLRDELERLGITTKARHDRTGRDTGGRCFTRGHLYQLLSNPIYIGQISHHGKTYPGQHEAIIPQSIWNGVQHQLKDNAASRQSPKNAQASSALTGLVYDDTGDRMSPTHANKKGIRYRYYISNRLMRETASAADGWRLPARQLERAVYETLSRFMTDGIKVIDALGLQNASPDQQREVISGARLYAEGLRLESAHHADLKGLVHRVMLQPKELRIEIKVEALHQLLSTSGDHGDAGGQIVTLTTPLQLKRRGVEARLVIADTAQTAPDKALMEVIAQAHCWMQQLVSGKAKTIRDIASRDAVDESDVSRFLPLAFLAPDIVEAILAGKQPSDLTAEKLKRIRSLPHAWDDQRRLLGFPA
ncbi:MAG: recombinase family protein [Sphingomonadales bacterium]